MQVFVLYDGWAATHYPPAIAKCYVMAVYRFMLSLHRRGWFNRLQVNFRNHRKIVVIDGLIGFVGGHNVGDE